MLGRQREYPAVIHELFIDFKKACYSVTREVSIVFVLTGIQIKILRLIKMCLNVAYSNTSDKQTFV